jgi:uncharacterized protein
MSPGEAVATVAGESLVLLAERAAFWPAARTLLVADAHIGKAAAFRAAGVPVPRGTTGGMLQRLDAALARTGAARVLFLGDLLHAREGRVAATLQAVQEWRERHAAVEMVLVRGNHDTRAGDPPASLGIDCIDGPLDEAPFSFAHHPRPSDSGYVLAGHLHPAVRLSGAAGARERLPCFWFGAEVGVLPAFGEFTGLADVAPAPGDGVWVVAGDAVIGVR